MHRIGSLLLLMFFFLNACREETTSGTLAAKVTDEQAMWIAVIPSVPDPYSENDGGQAPDFGDRAQSNGGSGRVASGTADIPSARSVLGVWMKASLEAAADTLALGSQKCWLQPDEQSMKVDLDSYAKFRQSQNGYFHGYLVEPRSPPPNCSLKMGYIDKASVSAVAVPKTNYDEAWGSAIARAAHKTPWHKCPGRPIGTCYWCVGEALKIALGRDAIIQNGGTDINQPPHYAKFFAENWRDEKWEPLLGLRRTHYIPKDQRNTERYREAEALARIAPIGSIIVWDRCGSFSAGHIAIVTSPGTARADFTASIERTCGVRSGNSQRIIAIFTPTGRP